MRKMFSEKQIKGLAVNSVNAGIESGEIDLSLAPNNEFPLETEDYELSINTDESFVYISEHADNWDVLVSLLGKYLYAYTNEGTLHYKGLILLGDNLNITCNTLIPTDNLVDISTWKIFDK